MFFFPEIIILLLIPLLSSSHCNDYNSERGDGKSLNLRTLSRTTLNHQSLPPKSASRTRKKTKTKTNI